MCQAVTWNERVLAFIKGPLAEREDLKSFCSRCIFLTLWSDSAELKSPWGYSQRSQLDLAFLILPPAENVLVFLDFKDFPLQLNPCRSTLLFCLLKNNLKTEGGDQATHWTGRLRFLKGLCCSQGMHGWGRGLHKASFCKTWSTTVTKHYSQIEQNHAQQRSFFKYCTACPFELLN